MKAELDESGVLSVMPETPTEAYALRRWVDESTVRMRSEALNEDMFVRGSSLLVCRMEKADGSAT